MWDGEWGRGDWWWSGDEVRGLGCRISWGGEGRGRGGREGGGDMLRGLVGEVGCWGNIRGGHHNFNIFLKLGGGGGGGLIFCIFTYLNFFLKRYVWALLIRQFVLFDMDQEQIFNILGLNYNYQFGLNISIDNEDIGQNMIFWLLFIFVVLQFKMLRSKIYRHREVFIISNYFQ